MSPVTLVMYHYVRPIAASRYPNIRGLEVEQFRGQLDYIERHYSPISMEDLIAATDRGAELPPRPILLQFDDGYTDHLIHVAPELERRGITGCFFPIASAALDRNVIIAHKVQFVLAGVTDAALLVSDMERAIAELRAGRDLPSVEELRARHHVATRLDTAPVIYLKRMLQVALPRDLAAEIADVLFRKYVSADVKAFADELYLSVEQLKILLDAGHHIGCHTETHPWLGSLTREEQRADIASSLRLHDRLGLPRRGFTFCFPYGDYNRDTLDVLAELGCAAGFTAEVALVDLGQANRLALPRLDTIDLPTHGSAQPNEWTRKANTAQPASTAAGRQ